MGRKAMMATVVAGFALAQGCAPGPATQEQQPSVSDSDIREAVARNDVPQAARLLQRRPTLANSTVDGIPLLCMVAEKGSPEMAKEFLRAGANPNCKGPKGLTPLHLAARAFRTEMVKSLLDAGADPDLKDSNGNGPDRETGSVEILALLSLADKAPGAAAVKTCPDGHTRLRDVPVVYGLILGRPWSANDDPNTDMILGGCCFMEDYSSKKVVVCMQCNFRYETRRMEWRRESNDRSSFTRPFSEMIVKFPVLAGIEARYSQVVRKGALVEEEITFDSKGDANEVAASIRDYLQGFGFPRGVGWRLWTGIDDWHTRDLEGDWNGNTVHAAIYETVSTGHLGVRLSIYRSGRWEQ